MRNRRVFISINLDEVAKKYISKKISPLKNSLDVHWTKPGQYHITLSFLGFIEDEIISQICQQLREALAKKDPFDIVFREIELISSKNRPKMIWLKGDPSRNFFEVKKLVDQIVSKKISRKKEFEIQPHITLGRIKRKQELSVEQIFEIIGDIHIQVPIFVVSIDVVESVNEKGVWKHYSLEQIEL